MYEYQSDDDLFRAGIQVNWAWIAKVSWQRRAYHYFDYWSVDTIRRWRNGGKFDGKMLTEDQKHIYSIYQRILTLCNKEKAITEGEFFDLMYANANGWRFNEHKQYTFLRKAGKELLFIIVNFDHISVDVAINVPSHAFDFLQIPQMDIYPAVGFANRKDGKY